MDARQDRASRQTGSKIVECHETTLTEVLDREHVTIAASLGVHARLALAKGRLPALPA